MPLPKKIIATSISLNIAWTFIGSQIARIFHKDFGGILIGLVFLIIYSWTYFSFFDKKKKTIHNFLMLTMTLIAIFMVATFIVPILFINGETNFSVILFLLCSTVIAFISITAIVGHYVVIENKKRTIIVGSIVTTVVASLILLYLAPDRYDSERLSKVVNPIAMGFCIWQILTTFLIGRSIKHTTSLQPTKGLPQGWRT
jgi:hypothetical protein